MSEWATQNQVIGAAGQLVTDAERIDLAAKRGSAKQLRTICGGFAYDTGVLYGVLPSPDRKLTSELNSSMQDFFHASQACAVAGSTVSPATNKALARIDRGLRTLAGARALLARFGVH
ncbi:MAG: hypothetical protein ACRDZP_07015 [Acidimicrobiales bacterium]